MFSSIYDFLSNRCLVILRNLQNIFSTWSIIYTIRGQIIDKVCLILLLQHPDLGLTIFN